MGKGVEQTQQVLDYLAKTGLRDHPILAKCRKETAALEWAMMQISPEQGAFMQMLTRLTGAMRCIEVGVFTGYSSLAVALALPEDGRIEAFDISEEWTDKARDYWAEAGVAHKIDLAIGPANEGLNRLLEDGKAGQFDFAFIDADKTGYDAYYEACLKLLRPGGLIAIDNVLWSGKVADPEVHDPDTDALRALNEKVQADARVEMALVPLADGIMLAQKR